MRYVGHPIYDTYKIFHSRVLPSAWKLTHILSPPCGTVQRWDAEKETSHVSVVQAHLAPCNTDMRQLPIGHYRRQGMTLPVLFPAFQIIIAIHQKVTLWWQKLGSFFIRSPTALLFCTGLEMHVFLCQVLDDLDTVSPFKELYIFIVEQNEITHCFESWREPIQLWITRRYVPFL